MKNKTPGRLAAVLSLFLFGLSVQAQTDPPKSGPAAAPAATEPSASETTSEIDEIRRLLQKQQEEITELRRMILEQTRVIAALKAPPDETDTALKDEAAPEPEPSPTPDADVATRLTRLEERAARTESSLESNRLGKLSFGGDLRMQYDSIYGLLDGSPNINDPSFLGNELSSRQRVRFRLRFAVGGKIGRDVFTGAYAPNGEKRTDKEFEWGFRLSGGSLPNPASPNPVLTDFFSRKPFALDRAFVAWRPRPAPGLRIVAGKFEPNWTRTEMTIDNDVQVEGIGQTFSRDLRGGPLRNVTVSAWQLPLLERGSTFVRNENGTVDLVESRRNGRDLGLFGAQLQLGFALAPDIELTLSAANLHFTNTDAINPVRVFGNTLQLPVTVTIPASGSTPARTVTGVATISRELLVSGNGNLGLSAGTNAAVNRDGRLASRFNLVDLIARLEFRRYRHLPVTFVFDYVRNTGTRDVVTAGPGGADLVLPNRENEGVWAEISVRRLRKDRGNDFGAPVAGDLQFGYTFLRIEKDAVLSPFNWDDLVQPSDVRGHRLFFSLTADPRVTFNVTGLFNRRLHGLTGPFRSAPPGSLDREVVRLQFDTVFRF